jgi:hypothetical protein
MSERLGRGLEEARALGGLESLHEGTGAVVDPVEQLDVDFESIGPRDLRGDVERSCVSGHEPTAPAEPSSPRAFTASQQGESRNESTQVPSATGTIAHCHDPFGPTTVQRPSARE